MMKISETEIRKYYLNKLNKYKTLNFIQNNTFVLNRYTYNI